MSRLLFICLFAGAVSLSSAEPPSEVMQAFINKYKMGKHDLHVSKMKANKVIPEAYKKALKNKDTERYKITGPANGSDYFQYDVLYIKKTKTFWVMQSGGFAGLRRVFGPEKLE